jgi:hypothetical protein
MDYPQLFSFTKNDKITVKAVVELDEIQELFHFILSEEAYEQYYELDIYLQLLQHDNQSDSWSYIWGNDKYSSTKPYKHLMGSQQTHPTFRWLWGSSCQLKHKIFFWLLQQDKAKHTRFTQKEKHAVEIIYM